MRSNERVVHALTVSDILGEAESRLRNARLAYGHGTTNARDESAYLVLHALKLPFEALPDCLDRPVRANDVRRALELVERRIRERVPAAYITHEAWLGNFRFYVDERTIVPRSFIAELLVRRLAPWLKARERVTSILDLCTGSGCLAVMAAALFPRAHVDAVDLSAPALQVARRNVVLHELEGRVRLIRSDLFEKVEATYDLIITNPPYVPQATTDALPPEYRHEPRIALDGGRDGLDLVRRILSEAPAHLTSNGLLIVETGHYRKRVERVFPRLPFVWPETSGGDDCVFLIRKPELATAPIPSSATPPAPRRKAVRHTAPASVAKAAKRHRNARA